MVRLLGFVALIALVALVLLWSSEHFTPQVPAPEKAAAPAPDVQQVIPRPAPAQEAPPPPEVAVAAADAAEAAPRPAPAAPDREAPSPPVDAPAETPPEPPAVVQAEPPAGAGAGGAREAAPAPAQEPGPAATADDDGRQTEPATAQDAAPEAVAQTEPSAETRTGTREPAPATAREPGPAATAADDGRQTEPAAQDATPEAVAAAEARSADPAVAQNTAQPNGPAQDAASAPSLAQRPASPSGTAQSVPAARPNPASPAPRAKTPASEASPTSASSPASGSSPASASSPASEPAPEPSPSPSPESSTVAYAQQPAGGDTAGSSSPPAPASGDPPPRPAAPTAADRAEAAGARIEERLIAEEEFVALEQAQGRIDERTDAQRRRQEEDGWYGWGVLNEYADPDRAARLLGGVPVVRAGGRFHTVRERAGQLRVRPIGNVSAAYGAVGLRAHDAALKRLVRRAIASGLLLGRESDHELLHLFPRREAAHLGNKVVKVFECHLRESGLRGEAAERFRKQAKLRGAVVALRRANGGRLGVLLPRYFRTGEGRVPVAAPCREIDEESRRAALAMAAPAASGGG